jgi:hypothetical protein
VDKLYAKVLLANPAGHLPSGEMFVVPDGLQWQPVAYVDPWHCDHQQSMCSLCVNIWLLDHDVELPAGIDFPDEEPS